MKRQYTSLFPKMSSTPAQPRSTIDRAHSNFDRLKWQRSTSSNPQVMSSSKLSNWRNQRYLVDFSPLAQFPAKFLACCRWKSRGKPPALTVAITRETRSVNLATSLVAVKLVSRPACSISHVTGSRSKPTLHERHPVHGTQTRTRRHLGGKVYMKASTGV